MGHSSGSGSIMDTHARRAVRDMEIHVHPFWETPEGKMARSWLEAWGAVHRERALTGDPSAIPNGMESEAKMKRGSPSDPPDVLLKFADVERELPRLATPRQERLIGFIYVTGIDWHVKMRYQFPDGTMTDWVRESEEPPAMRFIGTEHKRFPFYVCNLEQFEAPELDEVAKQWKVSKRTFLDREHRRFARYLIGSLTVNH